MKKYENLKKSFCDVSRETFDKLETLEEILLEKNQELNLISKNSESDVWERHFLDSVQLFDLVPADAKSLVDIGSGAGFPVLILGIVAAEKSPYLKLTAIESTSKKAVYLNHCRQSLGLKNVFVLNSRAESAKIKADVITARALASLEKLCAYALPLSHAKTVCIFPKGEKHLEEIKEAQIKFSFDFDVVQSKTSESGKTLILKNIKERK